MNMAGKLRTSLKTRVILFVLVIFLIGIWSVTFYASHALHRNMEHLSGDQQFSAVSVAAAAINGELLTRLKVLELVAAGIDATMLENPAALQKLLEQQTALHVLFNAGVHVVGRNGVGLADVSEAGRIGKNFSDHEDLRAVLSEQKRMVVGRPLMGPLLQRAVFPVIVAIFDAKGRVAGALIGTTRLDRPNFLEKIERGRYGESGDYFIVAPKQRLLVASSDKSLIMKNVPASGLMPVVDRLLQGDEGSAVYVNARGVEVLGSAKGIPAAGWIMGVTLPTQEVFAPIHEMLNRVQVAAIFFTLLFGGLTWWMLRREFSPMLDAVKMLAALSDGAQPAKLLPVTRSDEIGDLIGGFNRLLDTLRQREEALKESEARYRAMAELSSDWYWEQDENLRFTRLSNQLVRQTEMEPSVLEGYARRDVPGFVWDEPELTRLEAISEARQPFRDFEIGRTYRNGPKHYVRMSGEPVFDASGAFSGYRGVGSDITERKRDERLLALEHSVARSLAAADDASVGLKAVMRTICETKNWERSTYWRVDEAAGVMRFEDSWDRPGLEMERYTERSRGVTFAPGVGLAGRVWQSGEPIWTADFSNDARVFQNSLGREIGMRGVFVFPVSSADRTIGVLAFFSREVREPDERLLALARVIGSELGQFLQRKQAEGQVLRLNAELEQRVIQRTHALEATNKELEAFSYSVSHDLRAPLRAIQGFSSLVEKQYAGQIDEQGRDMLRRVGAGALKMGLLIDDLLKLSQIARQQMRLGSIDLSALAWEVAGELQLEAPERKVEWVIAPQVAAEGDAGLLRVVLQNLMGNAWKYSAKCAGSRIEFGVCERKGRPAYFVRDNGAGFDAEYSDKLFGAFQRLHSPGEFSGTGIGLATVKRIIDRHGGEVGAEGRVGEGATFYFTLQ